jgi:hypothetical protein
MNKKVIRILQNIIDLNPNKPVYVVCNDYVREEGGVCPAEFCSIYNTPRIYG